MDTDVDVARMGAMHGLRVECGHMQFKPGNTTVQVPTGFSVVFMGLAAPKTPDNGIGFLPIVTCDNKLNDGIVTFTRHGGFYGDAMTMNYLLYGW